MAMKLRQYIRESIERLILESVDTEQFKGKFIFNLSIIEMLPNKRADVDWKNRGDIYFPSLDGYGKSHMLSKEDCMRYISDFAVKFNEEPIFSISGEDIKILNDSYKEYSKKYDDAISSFGTNGD